MKKDLKRARQIWRLKNSVAQLKYSLGVFDCKLDETHERVCEPEDRSFEITKLEEQKLRRMRQENRT